MLKKISTGVLFLGVLMLSGCGEVRVLDVDTKLSAGIQVEPVAKDKKSVFLRIKDMTGYASTLASTIELNLKKEGYVVVEDPDAATFKLIVNVIKFGVGTPEDQIAFIQAIDPKKAAEMSCEHNKVRTIRRRTDAYEKKDHMLWDSFGNTNGKGVSARDRISEVTSIANFADRTGIADIEIISLKGPSLKTRIMVGVNMCGGVFVPPTEEVDELGWNRLRQKIAQAVCSIF